MDSSLTPQNTTDPQLSPVKEGVASQEQVRKRTVGFSRESLLSNLEEIAKETEEIKQVLPPEEPKQQIDTAAIKREVEALDKKQIMWLWLYRGWLLYNIWQHVPLAMILASNDVGEVLGDAYILYLLLSIASMLVLTAPYFIQLIALWRKSLRLNNIAIKIMTVYGCFTFIQIAFLLFTLYDYGLYQKWSQQLIDQVSMLELVEVQVQVEYPSKEEYTWIALQTIGQMLFEFGFTYGGARFYRRYLTKRQNLLLKHKTE